jgi:hypothetical protein
MENCRTCGDISVLFILEITFPLIKTRISDYGPLSPPPPHVESADVSFVKKSIA